MTTPRARASVFGAVRWVQLGQGAPERALWMEVGRGVSPWRGPSPTAPAGARSPCPARQVLENRTKDSKLEMEVLENLQELKDLNQRQAHVDFEAMLRQHRLSEEERRKREQEEDERETA